MLRAAGGSGGGGSFGSGGSPTNTLRIITAAGAVTMTSADGIVELNKTVGAATAVTVPASPIVGQIQVVKDGKGDAGTNNITLSGTYDGVGGYVITTNYGAVSFYWNGTENKVVA